MLMQSQGKYPIILSPRTDKAPVPTQGSHTQSYKLRHMHSVLQDLLALACDSSQEGYAAVPFQGVRGTQPQKVTAVLLGNSRLLARDSC